MYATARARKLLANWGTTWAEMRKRARPRTNRRDAVSNFAEIDSALARLDDPSGFMGRARRTSIVAHLTQWGEGQQADDAMVPRGGLAI